MIRTESIVQGKKRSLRRTRAGRDSGRIGVERLERRIVLANNAVPATTLVVPPQALIGPTLNFTVGFSNGSASQAGYGPYGDLELPTVGDNGKEGVTFSSAT